MRTFQRFCHQFIDGVNYVGYFETLIHMLQISCNRISCHSHILYELISHSIRDLVPEANINKSAHWNWKSTSNIIT